MSATYFSKRDLHFNLYELLNAEELTQLNYYRDHDKASFDMILDAAEQISDKMLRPLLTEMDRQEPQLIQGQIRVHPGMKAIIERFGADGWINATFSYDEGGQQLPNLVQNAAAFIFQAANYSASVFPFLTTGAANLIRTFASQELKDTYTPAMYEGRWQGTMALTEPDAGSSLSDITTSASPTNEEGTYKIKGQKIYISCGDHDACENIVHLLLARIKGAPAGTKGISLFVVPKKRISTDGLEANDVVTAGVYHKMGYKGAPIAHLMFGSNDECNGYLVGEPHKGLFYMFQMMNEARVGVGMNAAAIATAAYHASLTYAKERPQGRIINQKDPMLPQTPIINHADVKRMLLFQKSVVEGSLSLLLYCSKLADIAHVGEPAEQKHAGLLLDLLTPIAKSYPSEMGCLSTSAAVQVLGGAGYTTDFPVEQYYREARIHPIHEGTTGIHGLDLLGRKVLMNNGEAMKYLLVEMEQTIRRALDRIKLSSQASDLIRAIERLQEVTEYLISVSKADVEEYLADATLYLEMFGITVIAWQWLMQADVAQAKLPKAEAESERNFYEGKLMTARYFFAYELVKTESLATRLLSSLKVTTVMKPEFFG
jgi:butyryl-CoA dehydrogenase